MAYQVILEPGRGQIREFEFPRVRPLMNFCAAFPCALTDLRKARERELATLHENRQSVVAELYALEKIEGSNRRGGKDDTCHHGLYVQKLENRGVSKNEEKKKKLVNEMINQQSAAKEHVEYEATQTYVCQLRTNTTACTWPANDYSNRVRDHSNNKARHPLKSLLGENKNQTRTMRYGTNACHSLVSSVDKSTFTMNFAWRSSTTKEKIVFPHIFVLKMYGTPSLHAIKCVVDK